MRRTRSSMRRTLIICAIAAGLTCVALVIATLEGGETRMDVWARTAAGALACVLAAATAREKR
jgi:hypothetical protein